MFGKALQQVLGMPVDTPILEAAKRLFWALAAISLVWTMGMLIIRQDIGEMLMELLRFIVVTGTFYWLLINASGHEGGNGFVDDIVSSFYQMSNGNTVPETLVTNASGILSRGLHVFYSVMKETQGGDVEDVLIAGGIATAILVICALMAAQFLVALVMAWMLSYAGIFLLGFGGARWTSQIAVSFYKHVVAIGIALLALHFIGVAASGFLGLYDDSGNNQNQRTISEFPYLGGLLAAVVLMMVLSVKIPQLLYTLVTGSPLGVFTGTATMAGHAFASGGGAAWSSAMNALPISVGGGGGGWGGGGARADSASTRADSVMDAVQRSASTVGSMSDPFQGAAGADPFGAARVADPYRTSRGGSVFAATQAPSTSVSAPSTVLEARALASTAAISPGGGVKRNESRAHDERGSSAASSRQGSRVDGTLGDMDVSAIQADHANLVGSEPVGRPDYDAELEAIEASRQQALGRTPSTLKLDLPEGAPVHNAPAVEPQQSDPIADVSVKPAGVPSEKSVDAAYAGHSTGARSGDRNILSTAAAIRPAGGIHEQLSTELGDVSRRADPQELRQTSASSMDLAGGRQATSAHATGGWTLPAVSGGTGPASYEDLKRMDDGSMTRHHDIGAAQIDIPTTEAAVISRAAMPSGDATPITQIATDGSQSQRVEQSGMHIEPASGISTSPLSANPVNSIGPIEVPAATAMKMPHLGSKDGVEGQVNVHAVDDVKARPTTVHGGSPTFAGVEQNDMRAPVPTNLADSTAQNVLRPSQNHKSTRTDATRFGSSRDAHNATGDTDLKEIAAGGGTMGGAHGDDRVIATQLVKAPSFEDSDGMIHQANSVPVAGPDVSGHVVTASMAHHDDRRGSHSPSPYESPARGADTSGGTATTGATNAPPSEDGAPKTTEGNVPDATRIEPSFKQVVDRGPPPSLPATDEVQNEVAGSEEALRNGAIAGDSAASRIRSSGSPLASEAHTASVAPLAASAEDLGQRTTPLESANMGEPQVAVRKKRLAKTAASPVPPVQPRDTRVEDEE